MEGTIKLNAKSPVEIAYLKGQNVSVTGLHLDGKGALYVCLIEFYNDEDTKARHKELFFHLPNYMQGQNLPPRKPDFNISDYDFCKVKVITGSLYPEDEISLIYKAA